MYQEFYFLTGKQARKMLIRNCSFFKTKNTIFLDIGCNNKYVKMFLISHSLVIEIPLYSQCIP